MDDIVKRIRQQSYFGLEPYEAADEIEQLRQRVAELEGERDAALAETKAMSDQHMEISRECITLKSALREALPIVKDWVHENAGAGHGVISTITAALGEEK